MKTELVNPQLQNGFLRLALVLLITWMTLHFAFSQAKQTYENDYLMPKKGKSMVELYSGVPYVAIGQYSYGFSDRFSMGLIYGYTPINKGFGTRLKAVLVQSSSSFRINMKSTFIYYPTMKFGEGDPWVLAWPAVNAEWKLKNGARIWTGAGIIGVSCVDMLFPQKGGKVMMKKDDDEKEISGIFNTFQFGYSKPLSNKTSFIVEVAPVMEGLKLKSKSGFLDAFPVIVTIGLAHSF